MLAAIFRIKLVTNMINQYVEILNRYLIHCWIFCLVPILICIILIIVEIKRKTFNKTSLLLVFIGIVFLGIGLWHTVDVKLDINQNSIISVDFNNSKYYADTTDSSGDFFTFAQTVTVYSIDGELIDLICREDIFPYDAQQGKIIYAKHTKMILEYNTIE